ncbi:NAD(P)-binding Rossmann-fold superfamily protein [Zea mays]|uniref:NAD(P)-binding Rossmann-fold superfamily protein n=1 Tax=Zea mays TaxID=4577 RepID=A0A1D6HJX5_MAIZE|nr:NAD(P)-binding Rossmann-fold superfamily protein [Zea mays]
MARLVLRLREDHRACVLGRRVEALQARVYALELRNRECYEATAAWEAEVQWLSAENHRLADQAMMARRKRKDGGGHAALFASYNVHLLAALVLQRGSLSLSAVIVEMQPGSKNILVISDSSGSKMGKERAFCAGGDLAALVRSTVSYTEGTWCSTDHSSTYSPGCILWIPGYKNIIAYCGYYRNITANTLAVLEAMAAHNFPINPYGKAKKMAEDIILDFSKLKKSNMMAVMILRYFNVIGSDPKGRLGEAPIHELRKHGRISGACFDATLGIIPGLKECKAVVVPRTICYQNKKDESGWWPRLLKKDLCS